MDWGKLQTFIALARSTNLERASRTLGVDGTTVSRKIRSLELELGHTLFERTRDGQVLTADGRRLFTQVETMERAAFEFEEGAGGASAEHGLVRVSAAEGFGTRFVAPHLRDFATLHPNISVDLYANSGFLNPSRKEADVALLLAQPRKGPLKTRKLTDYGLGLYIAANEQKRPGDVALIGYIPDFIYAPELNYLDELALGREPTLRSSSINGQLEMIAAGAGFGVLPCFMGDADGRVRRIYPEKFLKRTFWLAVHQDVSLLPRVRIFIDWLVGVAAREQRLLVGRQGAA
ncbi:MAG: LysR family transcriptional regulator [Sphingomonadales bacterium]|jgi:DNA-binding transcriptional LysR family regulator|nr:LysR family transcriptional regulator [Sphingomonadales bacterium]